ncbi:hypothetical protein M0805_002677 [Coniferiporia weirii]|nr:hypothetical protein M0805_002677 [Coniferiporia weirii]
MSVRIGTKRLRSTTGSEGDTPPRPKTRRKKSFYSSPGPFNGKVANTHPCSVPHCKPNSLQKGLYAESKSFILGPMLVVDFFETFLPRRDNAQEHVTLPWTFFRPVCMDEPLITLRQTSAGDKIHGPFVDCTRRLNLSSLDFVNTSTRKDMRWYKLGLKPDISVYKREAKIQGTRFSEMELFVELKPSTSYDPFEEISSDVDKSGRKGEFVKESKIAQETLGKMTSHAIALLDSSFRTHAFSVLVTGQMARFIRWDCAGAIVSEPVEYTEDANFFAEFFHRFDQLTPEQRGHDTTVGDPSAEEREKATEAFTKRGGSESDINYKLRCEDFLTQRLYKFSVPTRSNMGLSKAYYIGMLPRNKVESLIGRSSRGCPVYDLEGDRICYMKDTWRIQSSRLREGEIYKILEENHVPFIAPLVNEGDVGDIRMPSVMHDHANFTDASASSERSDSAPALPGDISSETDSAVDARSSEPLEDYASTAFGSGKVSLPVHPEPDASNSGSSESDRTSMVTTDSDGAPPSSSGSSIPSSPVLPSREVLDNMHITLTQLFVDSPWVYRSKNFQDLRGYIHYRLVLGVVGRELTSFKSSREMLTAIMDAIEAHGKAYEAGILHRDISIGNIMITHDGRGMLIDWDLAKPVDEDGGIRYGRTGTWQFMSAALLQNPRTKHHTYSDDLESFLHLATYMNMLYTQTNYSTDKLDDLAVYMQMYDEDAIRRGTEFSYAIGGKTKRLMLISGCYIPKDLTFTGRPRLNRLLRSVSLLFRSIYQEEVDEPNDVLDPEGVNHSGEDAVRKAERREAQKNAEIVLLNKFSEGTGTKIHRAFRRILGDESAWPTDDASRSFPPHTASPRCTILRPLRSAQQTPARSIEDYLCLVLSKGDCMPVLASLAWTKASVWIWIPYMKMKDPRGKRSGR